MKHEEDTSAHTAAYLCTERREALVAGERVCYALYRCEAAPPCYFVQVSYCGERSAAFLGEGETALAIFEMLVRGCVTPCTLADVVEDFRKSHTVLPCFADYC